MNNLPFFKRIYHYINFWHKLKSDYPIKISIILILVAILASLFVIVNRTYFENRNKFIDILVKYEDWNRKEGLYNFGVTAVSIPQETLELLENEGRIVVFSGGELENFKILSGKYKSIKSFPNKTYVFSTDEKLLNSIKNILGERFQCAYNLQKNRSYLEINADKKDIYGLGIGFDCEKIKTLKNIGYKIVLRFKPDRLADEIWIKLIFESVNDWNSIFGVLFEGDEVAGYGTNGIEILKTLLKKTNAKILNVEFSKVKGIFSFQKDLTDRVLRVHSIEEDRLMNMSFNDILSRFKRAVEERNIRVIYLQPLPLPAE